MGMSLTKMTHRLCIFAELDKLNFVRASLFQRFYAPDDIDPEGLFQLKEFGRWTISMTSYWLL